MLGVRLILNKRTELCVAFMKLLVLWCSLCHRMIEEGSKRGKAMVEKRQLFMEMSEWSRLSLHYSLVWFFDWGCVVPHAYSIIPPTQQQQCTLKKAFRIHLCFIYLIFFKNLRHCFMLFLTPAGAQNFDVIRLSTYRTACKLRFVQKRCNRKILKDLLLRLTSLWNHMKPVTRVQSMDHSLPVCPLPSQFIWWTCGTWSKPFVTTGSTPWTTTLKSMCRGWRPSCLPSTTSSTSGCPPPTRSMWSSPSGFCSTSWWPHTIGE